MTYKIYKIFLAISTVSCNRQEANLQETSRYSITSEFTIETRVKIIMRESLNRTIPCSWSIDIHSRKSDSNSKHPHKNKTKQRPEILIRLLNLRSAISNNATRSRITRQTHPWYDIKIKICLLVAHIPRLVIFQVTNSNHTV